MPCNTIEYPPIPSKSSVLSMVLHPSQMGVFKHISKHFQVVHISILFFRSSLYQYYSHEESVNKEETHFVSLPLSQIVSPWLWLVKTQKYRNGRAQNCLREGVKNPGGGGVPPLRTDSVKRFDTLRLWGDVHVSKRPIQVQQGLKRVKFDTKKDHTTQPTPRKNVNRNFLRKFHLICLFLFCTFAYRKYFIQLMGNTFRLFRAPSVLQDIACVSLFGQLSTVNQKDPFSLHTTLNTLLW